MRGRSILRVQRRRLRRRPHECFCRLVLGARAPADRDRARVPDRPGEFGVRRRLRLRDAARSCRQVRRPPRDRPARPAARAPARTAGRRAAAPDRGLARRPAGGRNEPRPLEDHLHQQLVFGLVAGRAGARAASGAVPGARASLATPPRPARDRAAPVASACTASGPLRRSSRCDLGERLGRRFDRALDVAVGVRQRREPGLELRGGG